MLSILIPELLQQSAALLQKYVFNDWNFIGYLLVVYVVDTCLGVWLSMKQRKHHSRQFRGMFDKFIQYGVVLIITHVLCEFTVDGQKNSMLQMLVPNFKAVMYLAVLWAEVKSIDENLRGLGYSGLPFPKFLRKRLADWEETGQVTAPTIAIVTPPAEMAPISTVPPIQEGVIQ
jgi:hypothetical protein